MKVVAFARRVTIVAAVAGLWLAAPCYAATAVIGTSTAFEPMNTAHKYFTHYANGHYWVAYDSGSTGGSFNSSPDGEAWTSLGQVFPPFPNINPNSSANQWAMRYLGNTVIALVFNTPDSLRYYRSGTLNSDGTVSWSALTTAGPADATFNALNVLIANGRPIMWRDDNTAGGAGAIWRGSAIASPTWSKTTADAPAMSVGGASNGVFTAGAVFQTGGANPDDLIVLRATSVNPYALGSHRLVAMKWNAATDTYDPSWYNVSTVGGTLTEDMTTEVRVFGLAGDNANQKRFAAVRDSSSNLHAVYVNRNDDMVHYRKAVGFNDSWSRISAGINPPAETIDMVALTALANDNLYLFFSKSDNRIYYRRFDGASWGAESLLLDVSPTLERVLAPPERAIDCAVGLAFIEGAASPWNVRFTLGVGSCSALSTSEAAGTVTVETPEVKMVWDAGAGSGGGLSELYGKNEANPTVNRRGDSLKYNVFSTQLNDGTWRFERGAGAGTLELLEATATRTRVRQTYDYTADLHLDRSWTVYGYPRLAIDETLVLDVNQPALRGAQGLHPKGEAVCGGANTFYCAGQSDEFAPVWLATDDAAAYSDMLAIPWDAPFFGRPLTNYAWNNALEAGAPNSWLARVHEPDPIFTSAGSYRKHYLLYPHLAGLTSGGTEWQPYHDDYRTPDVLTFNFSVGTGWEDANEDTGPGDFFNEHEAAYLVDFNPTLGLSVNIDGNVTTRSKPFFKIRQWRSLQDPSVSLEGTPLVNGVDYKADVKPFVRSFHCTGPAEFDACTPLANGGLAGANEYLNDASAGKNYTLAFPDASTWFYLGAESRFRGINVVLATPGVGSANLRWEYWNGASWLDLEGSLGWNDQTDNLKRNGTISWGDDALESDPIGWTTLSIGGSPPLYYVRARMDTGSYTTPPVEAVMRTDILLFQYCGDITISDATFLFAVPAPTAVKLMSFSAVAGDGAVTLEWRTASELSNLGFHLYRGLSETGPWARITTSLIPGLGSSPIGKAYSFRDAGLTNGVRHFYRLEDVDASSRITSHGPVSAVPLPASAAGASESGSAAKEKGSAGASCPDWVLAAYAPVSGSSSTGVSLGCTRHGDPEAASLDVVSRDARSATLELRTPGFYALHTLAGAGEPSGSVRLFVPGFDSPQDPQAAALPLRRALVDAVVGRRVQLGSVRALDLARFSLVPAAVGQAEMQVGRDGTVRAARRSATTPRRFPRSELALLLPSVFQGETKSAVVQISPLRFDAERQQLTLARRVLVRLLFTGREAGESGRGSRGRARAPRQDASNELLVRLYTTRRGLHAVSFEQLFPGRARGPAASQLRLERQGRPLAFHIEPASDSFGPGSRLFFFADTTAGSTAFSSEVAYELLRASEGVRMPLVSAAAAGDAIVSASRGTASFETNRFYQPGLLEAQDLWFWESLPSGTTRVRSFSLAGVAAAASGAAELDVFLQGASESGRAVDHHVSVSLGGVLVGEARFAGKRPYRLSLSVPVALLREGANELQLTNVADTGVPSLVFLDRFSLAYPQLSAAVGGRFEGAWPESGTATVASDAAAVAVVDVGSAEVDGGATSTAAWLTGYPSAPGGVSFRAEAGRRYLVVSQAGVLTPRIAQPQPSTLRSATNQADYLLIAPRAFLAASEPLLARRSDQGLRARGVASEEVFDEFGHGEPSAEAIRSFLAFAFHSWARPSVRYVVLLGDSSYDPRNFIGTSPASPLPGLFTKTSYLWTVSDPLLTAVNGDDPLPDLAIGRLPAATVEEARTLVDKLIAWEDSGQVLSGRAALVADNPDLGGDFEANVADIAQSFLAERSSELVLLRELGAETRPRILDALNSGLSLLSYVGHGGAAVWASENVWNSWDAASLQAQSQQPLLLTMNCLNGYFVAPAFDSLAESLLKAEGRGAIAAVSPSGLSLDGPAHQYHRALMAELTSGRHARLGDAFLAAQTSYGRTGLMPELLAAYHLFGDPALTIR